MKCSADELVFNILGMLLLTFIGILCVLPFILVVSGSFSNEAAIVNYGYKLWPQQFSVEAYQIIFKNPISILRAYGVTIFITVVGTSIGLLISSMTAYVLQRKDFEWRNYFSYFFFFTTLFSGGLVPWYILMQTIGMKNNIIALIIPGLLSVFNIFIIRNFMRSIPEAITESAKIDGANDFEIFIQLVLPLSKSALATVGLFMSLNYWNEWYNTMLFVNREELYPLQYYLYNMLNSAAAAQKIMEASGLSIPVMPTETSKLAMTVVATGPILLVYPYVQRYFVKGITVGSVKG